MSSHHDSTEGRSDISLVSDAVGYMSCNQQEKNELKGGGGESGSDRFIVVARADALLGRPQPERHMFTCTTAPIAYGLFLLYFFFSSSLAASSPARLERTPKYLRSARASRSSW